MRGVNVTTNNIHIEDSYKYPKSEFEPTLNVVEYAHPECEVFRHRSKGSMCREWATHNALYALHLFRSHTKDVDINWPINWFVEAAYNVVGFLVWPFIK